MMADWMEKEKKYFLPVFRRQPIVLVRGEGVWVWDENGKRYLDFVGGWAVNALGHCHPVLVNALNDQAHKLIQVSNQFYTIPQLQLAELLVRNSCLDRVFFSNSGVEANECPPASNFPQDWGIQGVDQRFLNLKRKHFGRRCA